MADLVSHVALAAIIRSRFRRRYGLWFFLAGAILPDIFSRLPAMVFSEIDQRVVPIHGILVVGWEVCHQPVGMLLVSMIVALLFVQNLRTTIFFNLYGGMMLHLATDMFQNHQGLGYMLGFPFSNSMFELGLIGTEASVYAVVPLSLLAITFMTKKANGTTQA